MKALVYRRYGGPDVLELADVPPPQPREHEVLVRVRAASINAADRVLLRGEPFLVRLGMGFPRPRHPTLGFDVAGRVESVGGRVTQFRPGEDVFGASRFGAFAELVCVNEETLVPKPAGVSFEEAAATPTAGYTALQGLRKGRIEAGQKVLIDGASGGVGTFAIQIAKAYGADVTAVCSTRNVEIARALGAARVIDYRHEDLTRDGQRYDLILAANAYRPLADYRRVLKPDGAYVMTGGGGVQILQAMLLGAFVSMTSSRRMGNIMAVARKSDLVVLKELLETGKIKPVIDKTVALSDVPDAIRYLEEQHARGKVVVRV
ncbi:MAG TPA: NAD(P)-dependent alcohol dehydrogenase [Gammaproteobacteria bacterium]|jgi:NADPH:quinone reductase-like Zn-dependent oxidoreductase|nr:NAD(P)-dependent alcohol dehydrogenase [Gammaproteobacteria bacterium]